MFASHGNDFDGLFARKVLLSIRTPKPLVFAATFTADLMTCCGQHQPTEDRCKWRKISTVMCVASIAAAIAAAQTINAINDGVKTQDQRKLIPALVYFLQHQADFLTQTFTHNKHSEPQMINSPLTGIIISFFSCKYATYFITVLYILQWHFLSLTLNNLHGCVFFI